MQGADSMALFDSEVASELDLTEDQKNRLLDVRLNHLREWQESKARGDLATKIRELDELRETKSFEVLTKDQKAKLETLKGAPFDFDQITAETKARAIPPRRPRRAR